jgi:hypothetical protein
MVADAAAQQSHGENPHRSDAARPDRLRAAARSAIAAAERRSTDATGAGHYREAAAAGDLGAGADRKSAAISRGQTHRARPDPIGGLDGTIRRERTKDRSCAATAASTTATTAAKATAGAHPCISPGCDCRCSTTAASTAAAKADPTANPRAGRCGRNRILATAAARRDMSAWDGRLMEQRCDRNAGLYLPAPLADAVAEHRRTSSSPACRSTTGVHLKAWKNPRSGASGWTEYATCENPTVLSIAVTHWGLGPHQLVASLFRSLPG